MSEPSSSSYQDGEVVWVKWSNSWWPGEVYSISRVPEDMTSTLRKPVIAFVKFLQEDSFELVRSKNNISKYECDKKMDHIKKGMDKYRTNATMKENFSACIVKAEQLTGGNVNILSALDTPTKSKASSNPSTPVDTAKKSISLSQTPQLSSASVKKLTATTPSSYNSSVKVQNTTSAEQNRPNEKRLTCTMCPFTTDRMNLLMMHIKGHSLEIQSRVSSSSSSEMRRPIVPKITAARKLEVDDGIADDVRKIKESMKEQTKSSSSPTPTAAGRKSRAQAAPKPEKVTPKIPKSRAPKRGTKITKEPSPEIIQSEEEIKPKVYEELKKELLADWSDDDEISPEKEKIETLKAPVVEEKPKAIEKVSEKSSVPIRNIPKKQRVSEIYIQPENTTAPPPATSTNNNVSLDVEEKAPIELSRKSQTSQRKRKLNASEIPLKEEKMEVDDDEKLLMATAEMLSEIEVPTKSVCVAEVRSQSPSTTFQKSNDIDKRNLPPKERNKRIFRARNKSPDPVASSYLLEAAKVQIDEPTALETVKIVSVNKNDRQELMLPHKKKQSSRLLQPTVTEPIKNQPTIEVVVGARKKKRKSSSDAVENEELPAPPIVEILPQSPLRESASEEMSVETLTQNRGQKRHLSNENSLVDEQTEQPELKKFHKSSPLEPRTITCGANETICITSKGTLAVARRDSLKTTQANSVVVTSQVIISEPIASPEVVTTASKSSSIVSLPQQALKNALKIPKENMEEFKKQGLLTIENNRTKLTPKGLQIFKEYQRDEKTVANNNVQTSTSTTSVMTATSDEPSELSDESSSQKEEEKVENSSLIEEKSGETDLIASKEEPADESDNNKEITDSLPKSDELKDDDKKLESDQNGSEHVDTETTPMEVDGNPTEPMEVDENPKEIIEEEVENSKEPAEIDSVMPNDDEKKDLEPEEVKKGEPKEVESSKIKSVTPEPNDDQPSDDSADMSTKEEDEVKKPLENGSKEVKDEESEDANTSSGAGLIALQAENFGGPANCFYLCRQVDDRYEPVDNQILVLNAQNALVPYEGEVNESALTPAENPLVSENLSAYSQLSPNSNIIINTPSGQKVELNNFAIMALQESADENGIASMEYAGEQFELNINAILEAIAAQDNDDVPLIDGIVDGTATNALILTESSELPLDIKHSATQVSETLTKPIMSTTVAPEIATTNSVLPTIVDKSLNIDDSLAAIGVTQSSRANVPKSLELPITVTNPTIADTVNLRKLDAETLVQTNKNNGSNE